MTAAPDLATPIAGWRAWRLERDAGGPTLGSPIRDLDWTPRRATTASCAAGCDEPPGWDCHCGLYALAELADLGGFVTHRGLPVVVGCTALWGRVVEATAGWRAELSYPLVLFVRPGDVPVPTGMLAAARLGMLDPAQRPPEPRGADLCRVLGERYGVPVHLLPSRYPDPLHPGHPSTRESRRWRGTDADVLADRPPLAVADAAGALLDEAAGGSAARRLGDRDAEQRLERAVDRLLDALRPDPPPTTT